MNIDEYLLDSPHSSIILLAVAIVLAFGADRFARGVWNKGHPDAQAGYRATVLYGASHGVAISARVYLALVATEVALQRLPNVSEALLPQQDGDLILQQWNLREAAPSVAITIWVGMSACTIKRVLLLQSVSGRKLGRVALVDRFFDFLILLMTFLSVLDILNIDLSTGMQAFLSGSGIFALVFSLASKDLAEGIVGGFAVQAWDAFTKGDIILLGDGTEGVVQEIGLVETHIKGYDSVVTRIPNGQLTTARVSNLSRSKRSRVVQNLRFKYEDLEKLPAVLEEIKQEIRLSCPKTVTDGSAAFYAFLDEYKADHIAALVIANFDIPPRCLEYKLNRQECLLAIARAMKKHGVSFAIPSIEYQRCISTNNFGGPFEK